MMAKKIAKDKLAKKEKMLLPASNFKIVSRKAQRHLNILDEYGLTQILEVVKITEKPQYILWNDGKPIANEVGGTDVIAYLYIKDGEIRGWSI
jgi:hypothetical protein